MKRMVLSISLICVLLLTGCFTTNIGKIGGADGPTSILVTENGKTDELLKENYVNELKLPVLDIHIAESLTVEDRKLILNDSIENNLELLIYDFYKHSATGNYEEIYKFIADENFANAIKNEEENFNQGIYMQEVVIEDIDVVDRDDLHKMSKSVKPKIEEMIDLYNWEEFAIVDVELEIKHNKKSLERGPQVGNGEIERYFLLGKPENGDYKIYEFYWEGLISD